MAGNIRRGGLELTIIGLQQFLTGIDQSNRAMQVFGQQAQQTAQATNAGFAQSAQAASQFGQQMQMTGEVTNASLAEMVNQLKYNVSDQAIEALTGLTSRAQDILQTVTDWKIPAPELDAAGWNRVAELMREGISIRDRKAWEAEFKAVSDTVVTEQQKMAAAAEESAKRQKEALAVTTQALTQFGIAATAAGAAGFALLGGVGLQASRIEELAALLEVTRANAQALALEEGNLNKATGLNATEVAKQVQGIRDLHLTGVVANETVAQLIRYNLDYTQATELARLAQDAATFAMQDSSQAVEGLIHGITTLQPRILRTYGIMVNLTEAYRVYARENDLIATELTQAQRQQAAFNAVLAQAPRIAGAYEAAMETASKQMRSLQTDLIDLKEAFGEELTPTLNMAVGAFRDILHWLTDLPDPIQAFAVSATGAGSALLSLAGTSALIIPRLGKIATAFNTLSAAIGLSSKALLGIGVAIPLAIGALAYFDKQRDAMIDLHAEILATSDSYEDYVAKLDNAGLSTQALTRDTYDLIAAQEAEQRQVAAQEIAEFQKRVNDEISITQVLLGGLGNLWTQAGEGASNLLEGLEGLLQKVNIDLNLTDNLIAGVFDETGLLVGSTDELNQLLSEMASKESWRAALGDPNFVANLRKQYEDADPRVRRMTEAIILFGRAIETGGLPNNMAMQNSLVELGFSVEEITELMRIYNTVLAQVADETEALVGMGRVAEEFFEAVDEATKKGLESLNEAYIDRNRDLEDLDREYTQKAEDAWIEHQRDLAETEGALAQFRAGTLQELLDLDRDYLQEREDEWTKYQQNLADLERDIQRDIEDANRDRAQAIADADRDYAQDRADALRDFNQDIEDNAREHTQKLLEIELDYQQDGLDLQEEYQQKLAEIQNLGQQRLLELQLDYEEKASDTRLKYLRKALGDIEGGFYAESFKTTLRELFLGLRDFGPGEIPNEFRDAYAQMLKDLEALREDQKWEEEDLSDDITREYDGRLAELEQWLVDEQAALDKGYEEKVAKEQERFAEEQEERRRDYEQKLVDLQLAHGRELQEIDINNQRKLDDIQIQAERERAELALTYQRRLDDLTIEYDREKELIGQKLEEQNQAARDKYTEALNDLTRAKEREREEIDIQHGRRLEDIKADFDEEVKAAADKWGYLPEALQPAYDELTIQAQREMAKWKQAIMTPIEEVFRELGIQSPSKLMMKMAEGILGGLDKGGLNADAVSKLMTSAFDAQAFQANISAALPANMATVPGGLGGSTRNFSSTSNLTVNASYAHQSEASLRDDLALYTSMMRAWGR